MDPLRILWIYRYIYLDLKLIWTSFSSFSFIIFSLECRALKHSVCKWPIQRERERGRWENVKLCWNLRVLFLSVISHAVSKQVSSRNSHQNKRQHQCVPCHYSNPAEIALAPSHTHTCTHTHICSFALDIQEIPGFLFPCLSTLLQPSESCGSHQLPAILMRNAFKYCSFI